MRLVIEPAAPTRKIESVLLKAVARANQCLSEILSGRSNSLVEIGQRTEVNKCYVSRIVRFAFLAPSIIEDIARGHQPPSGPRRLCPPDVATFL
jgi:hypothetical protein